MGAQKSIHAGQAKIDVNVDFTHKLCTALMLHPFRHSGHPLSQVIGSLCIKHPNLFGGSEKLDVSLDKGLYDSNIFIAYRRPGPEWLSRQSLVIKNSSSSEIGVHDFPNDDFGSENGGVSEKFDVSLDKRQDDSNIFIAYGRPRPEWLSQQSVFIQHSTSPEIGVFGSPIDNFSRSASGGVNLCRFSAGVDLNKSSSTEWSNTTSIKFERVGIVNDDGRSISRDRDGFPVTFSGSPHDSMVVLKQESRYAKVNDHSFSQISVQVEQGIRVLPKWLMFNRAKLVGSKRVKLGPALFLTSATFGSVGGYMAPYQAIAIGGLGSIRGYGEGAVGSGRSCLILNNELTLPLNKMLEGAVFLDCGTDLNSGHHVPGNPAMRKGKPGSGIGMGYGLRLNCGVGQFQIDYAINAFNQKTVYFGISNIVS